MLSNLLKTFKRNSDTVFFSVVFAYLILIFREALTIKFFQDDYFFLKISKAKSTGDFLHFYSPFHEYSYKPLATETFYFILHLLQRNVFLGHLIVFITYFIGLIFLYKIIKLITNNVLLARISVFLYAVSFIHVFQLYWFATFQEIAMFTFLTISFFNFLKHKYNLFIVFFILAALCKETAVMYLPFVILFVVSLKKGDGTRLKKQLMPLLVLGLTAIFFWFIYRYSLTYVTSLDNYKIAWHPKLLLSNSLWHLLWGFGFPNFMPDYFSSFLSRPIPAFWETIKAPYTKIYLQLLMVYLSLFASLSIAVLYQLKRRRQLILELTYCLINFFIFLGPILFFPHKWMIRLTLPLIFIALFQGIVIKKAMDIHKYFKYLGIFLIILYGVYNYFGILVHERTSTYLLENSIYSKTVQYMDQHRKEILTHDVIYFKDTSHNLPKGWNGSEKLKNSFSDASFLDYYFPQKKMRVIYGFESEKIPENAYIIESDLLL